MLQSTIFLCNCHVQEYNLRRDMTKQIKWVCAQQRDQPGHRPSLIRVFSVRMKNSWALSYLLRAQRRLWSDWADAQADLSLRWAHTHFVGFVMSRLIYHSGSNKFDFNDHHNPLFCWFCVIWYQTCKEILMHKTHWNEFCKHDSERLTFYICTPTEEQIRLVFHDN